MTILVPVISPSVDKVLLKYLSKTHHEDRVSTVNGDFDQNNNNQVDKSVTPRDVVVPEWTKLEGPKVDVCEDLVWANEPWTQTPLTNIPTWMRLKGIDFDVPEKTSTVNILEEKDEKIIDFCEDLVWANEPWTQTPLTNIPTWMRLKGIDYDVPEKTPTDTILEKKEEQITDIQNNDDDLLESYVEIGDWCEEKYEQLPLDVPRWACLPGIDFPVVYGNSPYWDEHLKKHSRVKRRFARKFFPSKLPILLEEMLVYNNDAKPMMIVPTRYGRRCY